MLDRSGARLAALATALYPLFIYSAGADMPVTLQVALIAGGVLLTLVAVERSSARAALGAGLLGAWATLVAASALPVFLLFALWMAWNRDGTVPSQPLAKHPARARLPASDRRHPRRLDGPQPAGVRAPRAGLHQRRIQPLARQPPGREGLDGEPGRSAGNGGSAGNGRGGGALLVPPGQRSDTGFRVHAPGARVHRGRRPALPAALAGASPWVSGPSTHDR